MFGIGYFCTFFRYFGYFTCINTQLKIHTFILTYLCTCHTHTKRMWYPPNPGPYLDPFSHGPVTVYGLTHLSCNLVWRMDGALSAICY